MNYIRCILLATLLFSSCSPKQETLQTEESLSQQLTKISTVLEKAYWEAEEKRIADASKSKGKQTPWETFEKEHEVKVVGIHKSDTQPPTFTGVIRLFIPSIKDAYYEFQFESKGGEWYSIEAFIKTPDRQRNFYTDPFPNSKSLKEYFPAELKKLGAPIIIK